MIDMYSGVRIALYPQWSSFMNLLNAIGTFMRGTGLKGGRMGRSDKVSLWCVALLINTRFRFFILE